MVGKPRISLGIINLQLIYEVFLTVTTNEREKWKNVISSPFSRVGWIRTTDLLFQASLMSWHNPDWATTRFVVDQVGLEPTNLERRGFTVPGNCRYATDPNLQHVNELFHYWVLNRSRIGDIFPTKEVLCLLSYTRHYTNRIIVIILLHFTIYSK